jgi:hypothetical protein
MTKILIFTRELCVAQFVKAHCEIKCKLHFK